MQQKWLRFVLIVSAFFSVLSILAAPYASFLNVYKPTSSLLVHCPKPATLLTLRKSSCVRLSASLSFLLKCKLAKHSTTFYLGVTHLLKKKIKSVINYTVNVTILNAIEDQQGIFADITAYQNLHYQLQPSYYAKRQINARIS